MRFISLAVALFACLAPAALADISFDYTTGSTLYVRFKPGNIAVDLTEGAGLNTGWYTVTDNTIDTTTALTAGTYGGVICVGSAAGQLSSDPVVGVFGEYVFNGSAQVITSTSVAEILLDTGTTLDDLVDDLEGRLTALRAGYIDNLSAGAVATAAAQTTLGTTIATAIDALPTNAELPGLVWNAAQATFNAAGSMGEFVNTTFGKLPADDIAGEGDVSGGATVPVNQVPVPESRVWIPTRKAGGLVAAVPIGMTEGEPDVTFAIDFRNDLANNGRLSDFDSIEILEGTADGVTFDADLGVDKGQAKVKITAVTADTYTLKATVTRDASDGGGEAIAIVTLIVNE